MTQKKTDSTIEDIHQIRRDISDRFGGDVYAIAQDAARRQAASNRPIWEPQHDEPIVAPESPTAPVTDGDSKPATQ